MEHDQCQACVDVTLLPFHRGGGGGGGGAGQPGGGGGGGGGGWGVRLHVG